MSAQESLRVARDSGDISLEALIAGGPIADQLRATDPRLMPELAPHLLSEMLMSLRVSGCSSEEIDLVAKSLAEGIIDLDNLRDRANRPKGEHEPSLADLDY